MSTINKGAVSALEGETIIDLLCRLGVDPAARHIAVAVNDSVARRADWPSRILATTDRIEVVRPFQGG